jgi:hypothetical protein
MAKKNGNKRATATITPAQGAKPQAQPAANAAPAAQGQTLAKRERKPGPYAGQPAGSNVEYTLPTGTKIQALVTKDGHCACPTCGKTLATSTVNDAQKVERVKEREQERIGGLQAEFKRIGEIIAKERARTGLPALSQEELFQAVLAYKAPEEGEAAAS